VKHGSINPINGTDRMRYISLNRFNLSHTKPEKEVVGGKH